MEEFLFTEDSYKEILIRLDAIEDILKQKQKEPEDIFLDNQEFLQLMNISKRTAQAWRNENIITYSQVGNKIYYCMSDIHILLTQNRVKARSNTSSL